MAGTYKGGHPQQCWKEPSIPGAGSHCIEKLDPLRQVEGWSQGCESRTDTSTHTTAPPFAKAPASATV